MLKGKAKLVELLFWSLALVALYFDWGHHLGFSLCLWSSLGFEFCPGCGLGRSIHSLLHGQWVRAWQFNPLGYLAIPILFLHLFSLSKSLINEQGKNLQPHSQSRLF